MIDGWECWVNTTHLPAHTCPSASVMLPGLTRIAVTMETAHPGRAPWEVRVEEGGVNPVSARLPFLYCGTLGAG